MNDWEGLFVETMRNWIDLSRSIDEMTDFADHMRIHHSDQPGVRRVLDEVYKIRAQAEEDREQTIRVLLLTISALNLKDVDHAER